MRKRLLNRITIKLIGLTAIAFIVSLTVLALIGNKLTYSIMDIDKDLTGKELMKLYNIYSVIIVLVPVIVFLIIFVTGINKRIKYLQYIINKMDNIHDEIYIDNIQIQGNDELSDLARSINIMSKRLKENYEKEKRIEESKNELIASVSHDLKTPLTSIIGYMELIKNKSYKNDKEKNDYIDIVYNKSNRLNMLIKELFEYTYLNSPTINLNLKKVNIISVIQQLVVEHIYLFQEKNVEVKFQNKDKEIYCLCDIEKFIRVIDNIIKNAEKYCYINSIFKIYINKCNENKVKIIFENQGENIPEKDLKNIFIKFYRMDKARTETNEGSGLGLAIAKKIIKLHNGDIWAESYNNTVKINIMLDRVEE